MGQLRRLLSQPVTGFDMTQAPPASAALAHALSALRVQAETHYSGMVTIAEDYSPAAVVQVAGAVRERSAEQKKKVRYGFQYPYFRYFLSLSSNQSARASSKLHLN